MFYTSFILMIVALCLLIGTILLNQSVVRQLHYFFEKHRLVGRSVTLYERTVGDPAPEIEGVDLQGRAVYLDEMQDRSKLVLFVKSSCDTCRDIVHHLHTMSVNEHATYHWLGITYEGEQPHEVPDWMHLIQSDEQFVLFGVTYVPSLFVINRSGVIVERVVLESLQDLNRVLEANRDALVS